MFDKTSANLAVVLVYDNDAIEGNYYDFTKRSIRTKQKNSLFSEINVK